MQVYKYDEQTKEYTQTEQALIDPLETELKGENVYLLPANATFEKPNLQDGFASVWNGTQWENIEDNRGKEYWLDTDTFGTLAHTMKELGAFPAGAVFTAPVKTLEQLKQDKINEFKNIRDTEEVKPISYNGNLFDFDDKARDRINSATIALSITGQSIEWTTADNTNVLVTANDMRGVVANVAVRSNELHVKYRELKEQVENCTTKEELDSIKWDEENSV